MDPYFSLDTCLDKVLKLDKTEKTQSPEEDVLTTAISRKKVDHKHDLVSFFASSEGAKFHVNSFLRLTLSLPLLRACEVLGCHNPTPIQEACITLALKGRDICGSVLTGAGKTTSFTLPVLERLLFLPKHVNAIRVIILTPTVKLAAQVHFMVEKLAQFTDIRSCLAVGGLSAKKQESTFKTLPDIVVGTPGGIIDLVRNSLSINLDGLGVLILDEADRLLEVAFSGEIHELISLCPKLRQTILFSTTMSEQVHQLVKLSLNHPVRLLAEK